MSELTPMLPSSARHRKDSMRLTQGEDGDSANPEEENVKTKIEIFEKQRKRKADNETRGSPELTPRVTKLARKKKIKKKLNPTQTMLASMNRNIMKEFQKVKETIEDSKSKLNEIEKKTDKNSEAIERLEERSIEQDSKVINLETNIKKYVRDEIRDAIRIYDETLDEKIERQIILNQVPSVTHQAGAPPVPIARPLQQGPVVPLPLGPPGPPLREQPPVPPQEDFPSLAGRQQESHGQPPGEHPSLMHHLRQETRDKSWLEASSKNLPHQPPAQHIRPQRIDFDSVKNHKEPSHELTVEEIEHEFGEAPKWAGLVMEEDDWLPYFFPEERKLPWSTLLNGAVYDENRKEAVKGKIEIFAKIHCGDFMIKNLYVTTNNQVVAWIESTENRVRELFKRAAQVNNKKFRTKVYVPKMARQRKNDIDKILLDIKANLPDLRYIIRNAHNDLQVLLKRGAEGKYRQYPLEKLGSISPLLPLQKNQVPQSPSKFEEVNDGFTKVPSSKQSLYRQAMREKEQVAKDVISFVNGIDPQEF